MESEEERSKKLSRKTEMRNNYRGVLCLYWHLYFFFLNQREKWKIQKMILFLTAIKIWIYSPIIHNITHNFFFARLFDCLRAWIASDSVVFFFILLVVRSHCMRWTWTCLLHESQQSHNGWRCDALNSGGRRNCLRLNHRELLSLFER